MPVFEFEIHSSIDVTMEAESAEEARHKVTCALEREEYTQELLQGANYISDGRKVD